MLADLLDPKFLLVRYKPLPDELLSSWMVRLAWSNGQYLERFWRKTLGVHRYIWHTDVDRGWVDSLVTSLAKKTGTPLDHAWQTTFRSYEGSLWEHFERLGSSNWILSVGRKVNSWSLHGQQYCPLCLREDPMPYFRKKWRLAFSVVCPTHGIRLRDACPTCRKPITYHESEIGKWLIQDHSPLTVCPHCNGDFRQIDRHARTRKASEDMVAFQKSLYGVLDENAPILGTHQPPFPHLFFEGFHQILHSIGSNNDARRLREYMTFAGGAKSFRPTFRSMKQRFEELRITDRLRIIELAMLLLKNWPEVFVDTCRLARMALSHLVEFHARYPFWYDRSVRGDLNR